MEFSEWIKTVLSDYSFITLLTVGTVLMCCRLTRRKLFALRAVICVVILYISTYLLGLLEKFAGSDYFILIGGGKFIIQYILAAVSVLVCYKSNVMASAFCATTGYCLQHIAQRLSSVLISFIEYRNYYFTLSCKIAVFALACFAVWFLSIRRQKSTYRDIVIDRPIQLVMMFLMISTAVFIEMRCFQLNLGGGMKFVFLLTSICATLVIFLEISTLAKREIINDFKKLQSLLNEERKKFEHEKQNIDMINMKCHDIRHQIRAMEGNINSVAIKDLADTVNIYSSQIETGNEAINVVFAKYGLYCLEHGIKLTCLIDGSKLGGIPDHELYALFGNAMENAIHAVEKVEKEKRIISVSERSNGNLINISFSNYYSERLDFSNGLPVSKREGHGFGTRSMRMILEKNGGRLAAIVKGDLFVLNMFFSLGDLVDEASRHSI